MPRKAVVCMHGKIATKTAGNPEERRSVSVSGDCWAAEAMYQTRRRASKRKGSQGLGGGGN